MKMVPYNKNDLPRGAMTYSKSANYDILEEFANSNLDCAKVEGWTTKSADICAQSLRASMQHYHMSGIIITCRKGEVFMIKTENT